jgi:hypothetical protein
MHTCRHILTAKGSVRKEQKAVAVARVLPVQRQDLERSTQYQCVHVAPPPAHTSGECTYILVAAHKHLGKTLARHARVDRVQQPAHCAPHRM